MRILIVDDDYVTRTQLKALLGAYGDCDAAPNGDIAMRLFAAAHEETVPYDLVTMDIDMPDQKGQQVVAELRQWEQWHGLNVSSAQAKVLMVSALKDPKAIMSSFREGCEGYLTKPVTQESLAAALDKLGLQHP